MRNLIYISDFSDTGRGNLKFAIEAAKKLGGNVYSVFVLHKNFEADNTLFKSVKNHVQPFRDQGIKLSTMVVRENILHAVHKLTSKDGEDLIILHYDEHTNLDNAITPDTIQALVSNSGCPVLTFIGPDFPQDYKHIVLAIDNITDIDIPSLNFLTELAGIFNSRVHILNIVHPDAEFSAEAIANMEKVAKDQDFKNYSINTIINEDFMDGLNFFIEKHQYDIAVILNQAKDGHSVEKTMQEVKGSVVLYID